jgi:hypothetical protein
MNTIGRSICSVVQANQRKERDSLGETRVAYTDKQKRKAEHIEEGYEKRGVSKKEVNLEPGPQ